MRELDEKVVRNRLDRRAEPSAPPEKRTSDEPVAPSTPPIDITELAPTADAIVEVAPPAQVAPPVQLAPPVQEEPRSKPARSQVTNVDPRIVELEPLVRAGDWAAVARTLGPDDAAGKLPPNLGLVYALARKEKEGALDKGTASTELAMRCTAGLLGVAPDSEIALVIAKRLIRKNPVAFRERAAPPASITAIILVVALVVGSAIGWLFATGHVRVFVRF